MGVHNFAYLGHECNVSKYFTIVIGTDCFEMVIIVRHHSNMMLNNQKL